MALTPNERFLYKEIDAPIPLAPFPPETLQYDGKVLIYLGQSNYTDLIRIDTESQHCFCDDRGNFYEVCLNLTHDDARFFSIRTRQKP